MTTLLMPLASARSLLPPFVIFGVTPHYYISSTCLRLMKFALPQDTYEKIDHMMYHSYQSLVTYFFETYTGTKVYFYGEDLPTDTTENVLYICNHQSAIDWSLANFVGIRQNSIGQIRYVMKELLKYLPFFGPYFMQHGCIFVRRDGKQDTELRRRWIRFHDDRVRGYWIVIFPEGTRYTSKKKALIEKSEQAALAAGYEPFQNVLFPRTKAFELSLEYLRDLNAVYDLTIAFKIPWLPLKSKQLGPSLLEFVSIFGREVHMHFRRIPAKQIDGSAEQRKKWLYDTFKEKDRLLDHFYNLQSGGTFPGEQREVPLKQHQVYPYAFFYSALLGVTLATETGRYYYAKAWQFGAITWILTPLLYRISELLG